jgi:hypothetical protein
MRNKIRGKNYIWRKLLTGQLIEAIFSVAGNQNFL